MLFEQDFSTIEEAEVAEGRDAEEDADCTDSRLELFDGCGCAAATSAAPCNDEGDCACMVLPEVKERKCGRCYNESK